jgi:hypothetical protein
MVELETTVGGGTVVAPAVKQAASAMPTNVLFLPNVGIPSIFSALSTIKMQNSSSGKGFPEWSKKRLLTGAACDGSPGGSRRLGEETAIAGPAFCSQS